MHAPDHTGTRIFWLQFIILSRALSPRPLLTKGHGFWRRNFKNGSEQVQRATVVTNGGFHFNQSSRFFVLPKQITYSSAYSRNEMGILELNLKYRKVTPVHPFKLTVSLCFSNLKPLNLCSSPTWTIKGRSSCFAIELSNESSRILVASWIGLSNVFTTLAKNK